MADGKVKLRVTDFGIGGLAAQPVLERSRSSSSLEGDLSAVLTGAYSPLYASPQQMKGEKPDPRDDVYALGVIWHQLLTGDLTSPAPTGRRWVDELREQGTSDAALDLLSSCFESNPAHRPSDAVVLAEGLEAISIDASEKERMRPGSRSRRRNQEIRLLSSPSPAAERQVSPPVQSPRPIEPVVAPVAPARRETSGAGSGSSRGWLAAGALGLFAVFGIIIYVATDNGTVKITGTDDRMKVTIDGSDIRDRESGQADHDSSRHARPARDARWPDGEDRQFEIIRGQEKVLEVTYTPPVRGGLSKRRARLKRRPRPRPARAWPSRLPAAAVDPSPRSEPEYITTVAGRIKLKLIPAGEFMMGSDDVRPGCRRR